MRLINADAHECWACIHHATGRCDTFCDHGEEFELRDDVRNAPTIEAVPVVHSEWLPGMSGNYFLCYKCSQVADFDFDFCPNCGADMRKKVE